MALVATLALAGCGSVSMVPKDASPLYVSAYTTEDRTDGGYHLDSLTASPQRISVMMHFERPRAEVFEFLLAEVDQYDGSIAGSRSTTRARRRPARL